MYWPNSLPKEGSDQRSRFLYHDQDDAGRGRFRYGQGNAGLHMISSEIAGKTGTTNDNADGWFIGFSPQINGRRLGGR